MTNEEIIRSLLSLLGGGIAVAILNWVRLNKAELRERVTVQPLEVKYYPAVLK